MAPSRNNNKNDALSLVRKAGNRRKANRDITSRSRRDNNTTPETIDITNSDSDDEDDIVMEDNQIMEFTLKRLAINNRVRSQEDYQPMIKFDFELNTMLLSFNISKVNKTKGCAEIPFVMGDVQAMFYFEMKDAAVQNNIDVDLDSFIYFRAEAERPPGAGSGTTEYNFGLEFEDDEHLRDLIQAVEDSGIIIPIQIQPEDIEVNAKALIEDSIRKYKLQNSSNNLFNIRKVTKHGSSTGRTKTVAAQAIKNSNGPKVSKMIVLDLREEIKRLKKSEKMAKEEVKRAQDILLQASAIIVDETNGSDNHLKVGTEATVLLAVQELLDKNEGLEDKVKNFKEGIDKAKKVLEQAWTIVI